MENKEANDHDILILLDQKVDSLHVKVDKLTDDHEERIRSLEQNQWRWSGVAGVVGAGVVMLGNIIVTYFSSHHG